MSKKEKLIKETVLDLKNSMKEESEELQETNAKLRVRNMGGCVWIEFKIKRQLFSGICFKH